MDIQIKNESSALTTCSNISKHVSDLEGHAANLSAIIQKVKSTWQSSGMDQESYILELEKQCSNLRLLSEVTRKLEKCVSEYISNNAKTSSLSVGDAVGCSITTGYSNAGNAVNEVGGLHLSSSVDENSSIRGLAVVSDNGTITDMSYADGVSIEEFAKNNNVGVDRVAVDIGKNGVGQAWVPASTLK